MTRPGTADPHGAIGSVLAAGSVLLAVSALGALLAPGRWWPVSAATVLVLTVVTATVRRTGRGAAAATAAGLAATAAVVLLLAAGGPGDAAWPRGLGALVLQGVESVRAGVIPVGQTPGLELLVVVGAAATLLVVDLLALGLGRAGLAGIPLLALWSVPVSFGHPPSAPTVVVGGAGYLLLLWVTARPPVSVAGRAATRMGPREAGAVVLAAALAALALLGGPLSTATPLSGTVRLPASWGGGATGPLTLSTDLDLLDSLSARSDRIVLVYTTTLRDLGPLRTRTMVDFDGTRWDTGPTGELGLADGPLWPTGREDAEPSGRVRIRVEDLDEDRLPLPTAPRSVDVGANWWYDAAHDEVVGLGASTLGLTYGVRVYPRDLAAATLAADAPPRLAAGSPELGVPPTSHARDIADLALEVTAGAATAYDQAMALQSWFRNAGEFAYETQIPPGETDDAVWDFLVRRSGYCVQYATAMTVMARSLGIPARVAIGFLPGQPSGSDPDTFVVTARQAHAWPELWFAEAGWVRFEPTPAVQTGPPPPYADPFLAAPTATPTPTPSATAGVPTSAAPGAAAPGDAAGTTDDARPRWPLLAALGAALLTGGATVLARRRRSGVRSEGPEESWAEVRAAVGRHGVAWTDATTPRQAAALIRAAWPAGRAGGTDGPDGGGESRDLRAQEAEIASDAEAALDGLVRAVEQDRYAPTPGSWSADELDRWVTAVTAPWASISDRRGGAPSAPRGA